MIALAILGAIGIATTVGALAYLLRQTPHQMPQPQPAPQPQPEPHREQVCMTYQCTACRRRQHEHVDNFQRILTLVTEWTCPECVVIAAYEREFTS